MSLQNVNLVIKNLKLDQTEIQICQNETKIV